MLESATHLFQLNICIQSIALGYIRLLPFFLMHTTTLHHPSIKCRGIVASLECRGDAFNDRYNRLMASETPSTESVSVPSRSKRLLDQLGVNSNLFLIRPERAQGYLQPAQALMARPCRQSEWPPASVLRCSHAGKPIASPSAQHA